MSLFTSYGFAVAAYLLTVERQVRLDRPAHEAAAASRVGAAEAALELEGGG
jgi:hypothetical protein